MRAEGHPEVISLLSVKPGNITFHDGLHRFGPCNCGYQHGQSNPASAIQLQDGPVKLVLDRRNRFSEDERNRPLVLIDGEASTSHRDRGRKSQGLR